MSLSNTMVEDAAGHRRELTGYCQRMLGSAFDADDAVQETMVRAWTRQETFEGRSSVQSWLYRIATNVCLDMLRSRKRRAVPMELDFDADLDAGQWPTDDRSLSGVDPADVAATRDEVRLALVAALRALPARQRSVLILREVLRWSAPEVADLLGTSVASVNSALQRARATLATRSTVPGAALPEQEPLLDQYVAAFKQYDVSSLVTLLRQEAA